MRELGKMLKFVKPYRRLSIIALITLVGMVILDLTIPRLIEHIIDQGIRKKDLSVVLGTSAVMLAISALSVLIAVLNNIFSVRVGESVARDLREAIFVKVQGFSCGNLDRFSTGKIMVRLMSDTAAVQRLTQVTLRIGTRAHRLSTTRDADLVVVINEGKIIETGTHQKLLDQRGFYHHLYMSQFKGKEI